MLSTSTSQDNFNEEASFLGQYSGNRAIFKSPLIMKEASPELSTTGILTGSDNSDLLLRNNINITTPTTIGTSTVIFTHENQTAV